MIRKQKNIVYWGLRLIASAIMLQTLFFKFSGAPESIYIFSTLGVEPWGRIVTGLLELVASILILIPATTAFGSLLGVGLMVGAIFSHLTILGIVVQDDHGQLFLYACLVFTSCLILLYVHKWQLPFIKSKRSHNE
ncbi:DoxX family protein [Chryseosolibacter indicus]|uniref:DoxX family protein n=1 Tax=Chryseosolibacter indicus TaxID=2782351 RepID=A0ABS5VXZ8_9BACT|nr:DoxX family protein [Chryseosolibacter indicus]MBT1705634.1 DoxX family protein [Chryseosolibacter indicus]